jgi:RND family efflux transporter MFP subunit
VFRFFQAGIVVSDGSDEMSPWRRNPPLNEQEANRIRAQSSIEFVVNVPENLIGLAPFVTDVTVRFDALPDTPVSAEISEIGREASQATRTYPVTLRMDQPEGVEILPGMAGTATIVSRPPDNTTLVGIQIPATAVFTGDNMSGSFVWVIDEATRTVQRREVEVGSLGYFGMLVRSGLQSGDLIVTKGVNTLRDGEEIRIMEEPGASEAS